MTSTCLLARHALTCAVAQLHCCYLAVGNLTFDVWVWIGDPISCVLWLCVGMDHACVHDQPAFLSHRPAALSAGNSCRRWRSSGGIWWSCGRFDLSFVVVCVWMSLFDFHAGVFIRRRHPLCHVRGKAGWGCSRGFPAAGAGRICFLPQRLHVLYCWGPVEELSVLT
jgi:hypothetical protein